MIDASRDMLVELLELQKVDSTIDRLEARKRDLPEQAELDALGQELSSWEHQIAEQSSIVDEITMRLKKLDGEIEILSEKIKAEEAKLYAGNVTSPKELTALQSEVESLKRRIAMLEEEDLGAMEERENVELVMKPMIEKADSIREQMIDATKRRDQASSDIDRELISAGQERSTWVPKFDSELLAFYDELRASKGGVGAAALVGTTCQGCHIQLPAQEVERIRKAPGLVRCDECRRILVVT